MTQIMTACLIALLLLSAVTDIRWQKIPNWITLPGMAGALALHAVFQGQAGLLFSLKGIGIGIGILLVFYAIGGMGAGDVKLLGAVGGFLGASGVLSAVVMTVLIGGVYAVGLMVLKWGPQEGLFRLVLLLKPSSFSRRARTSVSLCGSQPTLRYGVVIALGTLASLYSR